MSGLATTLACLISGHKFDNCTVGSLDTNLRGLSYSKYAITLICVNIAISFFFNFCFDVCMVFNVIISNVYFAILFFSLI